MTANVYTEPQIQERRQRKVLLILTLINQKFNQKSQKAKNLDNLPLNSGDLSSD